MTIPILTRRELSRATLARQLLLDRTTIPPTQAIERLAGLQAQTPNAPYIGLWTRLHAFRRDDLREQIERRAVVRATLLRSTLHLATARDYLLFRPALQPVLDRALFATFGARARRLGRARLLQAALDYLAEPRTLAALRARLAGLFPDEDAEAMTSTVARAALPLVQIPPGGFWGRATGAYAPAEAWLGAALAAPEEGSRALILRHLAAFGPASVADIEQWSGLRGLGETLAPLVADLCPFRDERGVELFDLRDAPRPAADTPVPPRFLPEYDNLLLAHADRTRVVADRDRSRVFLSSARVRATVLLDGVVAGTWRTERAGPSATLAIEPFAPLSPAERDALAAEGGALIRFIADGARDFAVRFA